jgi:hypothetical protein
MGKMMKKIGILICMISVFMLTGCSNENLVNDFFDNKKSDDIEVLWDVMDTYDAFIKDQYETYAKTSYGNESIEISDSYLPVTFNNIINKSDLLNYELTDNRSYIEGSLSYTYLEMSNHKNFVNDHCQNIKEGIQCDGDNSDEYFTYYVNDNQVYILYGQVINAYLTYRYEMHFYINENGKKVFDFIVISMSSDLYLPANNVYRSIVVEDEGETYYTCWNFDDEEGNVGLEYTYHDFQEGSWLSVIVNRFEMYQINYFDPEKDIYYRSNIDSNVITFLDLEVYDDHILLAKMNPLKGYYKLNMMPISGWDKIVEIDDQDYPKNYELFVEGSSINDSMIVHLESRTGEYIYYEYRVIREEVPNDILDLSRFGLSSPYTLQFYLDEVAYFTATYPSLLEDANMNESFDNILLHFKEILNIS